MKTHRRSTNLLDDENIDLKNHYFFPIDFFLFGLMKVREMDIYINKSQKNALLYEKRY